MSLSKFKFNLFVSYSRKNENEVHQLCKFLRNEKYTLWIDDDQIIYGDLEKVMQKGIDDSEYFLCCLSTSYSQGKNTLFEYNYAVAQGKKIIFVTFENFNGDEERKEKFKPIDMGRNIFYKYGKDDCFEKILKALNFVSYLLIFSKSLLMLFILVKK
jgi:hypothetical protein